MQELLDGLNNNRYESNDVVLRDALDFVMCVIEQNYIEKERNVIVDAHIEGQRVFDNYPHTQWTTDQAELYYEKTFNPTKEKWASISVQRSLGT